MKGKPKDLCPGSMRRVRFADCVLNGLDQHVYQCAECQRCMILRVRKPETETGIVPRHSRNAVGFVRRRAA